MTTREIVGNHAAARITKNADSRQQFADAGAGLTARWIFTRARFYRLPQVARESAAAFRGIERICRIGFVPRYIARRAIDGRHVLAGEPQPGLNLSAVVASM